MNNSFKIFLLSLFSLSIFNGYAQNALHFDGTNDYIQTTFSGVTGTNNRTFEAWIKVDVGAPASNLCIVDYGKNVVGARNTFSVSASRGLTFISGGTNANIGSTINVITPGQWTHVAFVLNSGTGYLYVNGTQVGTGSLTTVNTPSTGIENLKIGQRVAGGSIPFEGSIDEVRIWNVARTALEITNNRNAEFCALPANLKAYYSFNQGKASSSNSGVNKLFDAVNSNNGTLNGFSLSGSASNWVSGATLTGGLSYSSINENACDTFFSPSGNHFWTQSGTYIDTLLNANNCDSLLTIKLTLGKNTDSSFFAGSCGPYTSPSGKIYTESGTYLDTVSNSSGCSDFYTIALNVILIDTNISRSGNILTSAEQLGTTYQWFKCDSTYEKINGETTQNLSISSNGNYAVRITKDGCADTSACFNVSYLGLDVKDDQELIYVYPNPTQGILKINLKEFDSEKVEFLLSNAQGQVLKRWSTSSSKELEIQMPEAKGLYLLSVRTKDKQIFFKVMRN